MALASRRFARAGLALATAAGLAVLGTASASAKDWKTEDTDNIDRSTANGRAYTTSGSFVWQYDSTLGYYDYRASFATNLHVNGPAGSCARLRVITKFDDGSISKRFPAAGTTSFGYYSYCTSSGKGVKAYGGADVSEARGQARKISSADISICYAPNSSTPATQCYNFTVNRGD